MLWLDGAVREGTAAPFDLSDRGLLLGDGVFDTLMVLAGRPVFAEAHRARLVGSAAALGFEVDPATVAAAVGALARAVGDGVVRVTATRGAGPRGIRPPSTPRPFLCATAAPLNPALMFRPVRLATSAIRRNETSPASRLKTLGYLDAVVASEAAAGAGADDALFLNTVGHVACTTMANVFAIVGDRLVTPPLADGVLAGIVRGAVLALAAGVGLEPREASLGPADLAAADAVFLTNSVRLVSPVVALDGAALSARAADRVEAIAAALCRRIAVEAGIDAARLRAGEVVAVG